MERDDPGDRTKVTSADLTHPGDLYGLVYCLSEVGTRIGLFSLLAGKKLSSLSGEEREFLSELMDRTVNEVGEIRRAISIYAQDAWPVRTASYPLRPLVEAGVAMAQSYGAPPVELTIPEGLPDIFVGIGQVELCVANVLVHCRYRLAENHESVRITANEATRDVDGTLVDHVRLRFQDSGRPLQVWQWLEMFAVNRFGPEGSRPLIPLHLASSLPWFEATGVPHNTLDLYWRTEDKSSVILEKLGLEEKDDPEPHGP